MEEHVSERKIENIIQALQEEVATLRKQRNDLDLRITAMNKVLILLAGIGKDQSLQKEQRMGITDACRVALMECGGQRLTYRQVLQEVQKRLPANAFMHKDPRASICTILGRLIQYGEVQASVNGNGKRTYEWAEPRNELVAKGT